MKDIVLVAVVGLYIISAAVTILWIGKPREPTTPAGALISVLTSAMMILAVLIIAGKV